MNTGDRMSAEEYRHLQATGNWPERFTSREPARAVPVPRPCETGCPCEACREERGEGVEPPALKAVPESSRPSGTRRPKVTPDYYLGERLFRVQVPVKPVSVNHLYRDAIIPGKERLGMDPRAWNLKPFSMVVVAQDGSLRLGFRRRAMTGEAKAVQRAIRMHLLANGVQAGSAPKANTPLMARLFVHGDFWTKAGDIRIQDVSSVEKLILDTVADYLGLQRPLRKEGGDEAFFRVDLQKAQDAADGFTLEIFTLLKHP